MIKKLNVGLFIIAMFLIIGCSKTEQTEQQLEAEGGTSSDLANSEIITLTFWHYYAGGVKEELDIIVEEFNNSVGKEKGIQIETVATANVVQLEEDIMEAAKGVVYAESMPDIFLSYSDKALELHNLGVLSDMNQYFTEGDKAQLVTSFLDSGIINDIQGIIPSVKSTELILLNDTAWKEFATATNRTYEDLSTWEGIRDVAREYYEYTEGQALFGMDSLENFIVVASKSLGLEIFDYENQQAVLEEDVLRQVFNYYIELYALGYFNHTAQFRSDDIRSGTIIGYTGSSASVSYFPAWIEKDGAKMDIVMKVLPYPSFEGMTPYVLSQGAGIAVGKTGEENEAAAAEFIKFFLEHDVEFAVKTSYIPAVQAFFDLSLEEKDALLTEYGVITSNGKEVYHLVMDQIQEELTYQPNAFIGSYDIRTELSKAFQLAADTSVIKANELRAEGMEIDQIITELELENQFDNAMQTIQLSLESKNIDYRVGS